MAEDASGYSIPDSPPKGSELSLEPRVSPSNQPKVSIINWTALRVKERSKEGQQAKHII